MWQKVNEKLLSELTENATLRKQGTIFFPQNIDKENKHLEIVPEAHVSPDGFSPVYGNKLDSFVGKITFSQLLSDGWEVELVGPIA